MKPVLIVEHCLGGLTRINESVETKTKDYILGGVFTEFNVKNRNDRIYTADKFLPHLTQLLERKEELGAIYGEFDHPDVFDTSLSRVSHTIQNIFYNEQKNVIEGEIKLLSTHWGKEAKALVDDGCPIFVSSRAAGVTESNGEVTIKKLFTYDAVADPGFSSARMEVKSLNESLGFNESANFRIYDMSDESKINELFEMNKNDEFVTKDQMTEYSNYLTEEMEKFKGQMNEMVKGDAEFDPKKLDGMFEYYEKMQEVQTKMHKYLDYLAEKVQFVVNENVKIKKTTDDIIDYNDYLAEHVEKNINYSEYLAENLDKSIDYGKYIAETLDKNIDFSEYIADHVDNNIKYSEYLAENLDKNIDYSEYIAENVDNSIAYSEYIAESVDNSIAYAEYIAENVDNSIAYAEYIAEHVDNNISYSEYIAESLGDNMAYVNYIAESLDKTVDYTKKLTEAFTSENVNESLKDLNEDLDLKAADVEKYYTEDEEGNVAVDGTDDVEISTEEPQLTDLETPEGEAEEVAEDPTLEEPVAELEPAIEPIGDEVAQPLTEEPPLAEEPLGLEEPVVPGLEQPLEVPTGELTPGEIVSVGDQTGEVMAYNPQNNIAVVQLDTQVEPMEVHESKLTRLGDKLYDSENTLKENINRLILETKKQNVLEEDPNFLLFLSDKKKAAYLNLTNEDKATVKLALKESEGTYTSEGEVLKIMNEALAPKTKSFEDSLLDVMPEGLKPIWENLDPKFQQSVLSQAKLFPNLDSERKIESFWNSRDLGRYENQKPSKTVLNENKVVDDVTLPDSEIERFKNIFQKLK